MKSILEIQNEIIQEFNSIEDWEARYKKIIDFGKTLPALNEEFKTDANKVSGCQSQVWLHATLENGKVIFQADSDAIITKGLVGLLIKAYSGYSPEEILTTPPIFITQLGFNTHLSQSRANGLASMVKQIKLYAAAFAVKLQQK